LYERSLDFNNVLIVARSALSCALRTIFINDYDDSDDDDDDEDETETESQRQNRNSRNVDLEKNGKDQLDRQSVKRGCIKKAC